MPTAQKTIRCEIYRETSTKVRRPTRTVAAIYADDELLHRRVLSYVDWNRDVDPASVTAENVRGWLCASGLASWKDATIELVVLADRFRL